jgi:hypothetical protein
LTIGEVQIEKEEHSEKKWTLVVEDVDCITQHPGLMQSIHNTNLIIYDKHCRTLESVFTNRGYQAKILKEAIRQAKELRREDLIAPKDKKTDTPVTFITTFQQGTDISNIIEEEKIQLELSPETEHIAKMKFLTAYRRNRTLKNQSYNNAIYGKYTMQHALLNLQIYGHHLYFQKQQNGTNVYN